MRAQKIVGRNVVPGVGLKFIFKDIAIFIGDVHRVTDHHFLIPDFLHEEKR